MERLSPDALLPVDAIDSEADFILCSQTQMLLSEHCTIREARAAFFKEAAGRNLGERLPVIYRREDPYWVPLL